MEFITTALVQNNFGCVSCRWIDRIRDRLPNCRTHNNIRNRSGKINRQRRESGVLRLIAGEDRLPDDDLGILWYIVTEDLEEYFRRLGHVARLPVDHHRIATGLRCTCVMTMDQHERRSTADRNI